MNKVGPAAGYEVARHADALLAALPLDGTPRTNSEIRAEIGLEKGHYYAVRDALLNQGLVTRSSGRGGKTARVVSDQDEVESKLSRKWRYASIVAFVVAGLTVLATVPYSLWWRDSATWVWNVLMLIFGAVTILAVGLALEIYRQQAEAAHQQEQGLARVLGRIQTLAQGTLFAANDLSTAIRSGITEGSGAELSREPGGGIAADNNS